MNADWNYQKQNHLAQAYNLFQANFFKEAFNEYEKALKIDPYYAEAYLGCANALFSMRRITHAFHYCQRATTLNPEYADALYLLAKIQIELSKFSTSDSALNSAINNLNLAISFYEKQNNREGFFLAKSLYHFVNNEINKESNQTQNKRYMNGENKKKGSNYSTKQSYMDIENKRAMKEIKNTNAKDSQKQDARTVFVVCSTLAGLFLIYFSFHYIRTLSEYWGRVHANSWLSRGHSQGMVSWQASKAAFSTLCVFNNGSVTISVDLFGQKPDGLACTPRN